MLTLQHQRSKVLTIFQKIHSNLDRYFLPALGLIVFLSVIRVFLTVSRSLTIDEPFTANLVNLSWAEVFRMFLRDPSAPLYYVLLKPWFSIFGDSEQGLRSLSVILFALTIIVVSSTAKKISGTAAGIVAAMLASISSIGITFAGTARPYALLSLLTAISTLTFFYMVGLIKANFTSTNRGVILSAGFILVNVLTLLTHPIFIFFMIGYCVAAWIKDRQQFWAIILCNTLTIGIYLSVWGTFFLHTVVLPATTWMEIPDIKDLIHSFLNLWGIVGTSVLVLYIILASLWNFRLARDFALSQVGLISLVILMAASLVPFLISQFKPVFDDSRIPALFFPLACVFVALLLMRLKNFKLTFGLLTLMFGFVLVSPVFAKVNSGIEHSPRSSVKYAVENAKCGDVFIFGGMSINETTYYMRRFNAPDCIVRKAFPDSMNNHPGWMDPLGLLQHSDELATEADVLVTGINQCLGTSNNVWFFYETRTPRQKVLDILKAQLNQNMVLSRTVPGYGTFFESILVYSPRLQNICP